MLIEKPFFYGVTLIVCILFHHAYLGFLTPKRLCFIHFYHYSCRKNH